MTALQRSIERHGYCTIIHDVELSGVQFVGESPPIVERDDHTWFKELKDGPIVLLGGRHVYEAPHA